MTTTNGSTEHHRAVIGNADHFWLYSSRTGFDLTCPSQACPAPSSPPIRIETTTSPITIDATKSALVIIDMQNYFLSEALGRSRGAGHAALDQLTEYAIPACRKAGIRILWVNWGLTEADVEDMPPSIKRLFGFQAVVDDGLGQAAGCGFGVDKHGMKARAHEGMGSEMGSIRAMETGAEVDAGRVLMRGSWNAGLYPPLDKIYDEGTKLEVRPDVWLHKNRLSGMRPGSELERFLEKEGLRTLFFAGVNTDQCVGGTHQDCFSDGYDCVLLGDGSGTTSPDFAQQCWEFNAANTWGFLTSCKQLAEGVGRSLGEGK